MRQSHDALTLIHSFPSLTSSFLSLQSLRNEFNSRLVPEGPQSTNHSHGLIAEKAFMPELLPRMHVTDVHFNERNRHSTQSISQSNTGMRQTSWVDDDEVAVPSRGVYAVDDVPFVV